MTQDFGRKSARALAATCALALLAGCAEPLDFDLRGKLGAFSTAPAAQQASTAARPKPDARGVISYPTYQVAVARRGDTVQDVAARIGLPAENLAKHNGLSPEQAMREGEVIALPTRVPEASGVDIASLAGSAIDAAPSTTPAAPASVETAALAPAPAPEPVQHKVSRGETAYTIARLYQVPVKSLAEWNGLGSDFGVREGQYLMIPVKGAKAPKTLAPIETVAATAPGAGSPTPTPPSAARPLPAEKVAALRTEEAEKPKPAAVEKPTTDPSGSAEMAFPVQGKIIRTYAKGRNEGIDIAADPGTAVKAAADGSVAAITESTDDVPIVVVRHPGNLLTVYANVDGIKVKKGQKVTRGQQLASLRSGDDAYVHFEVRNGFDSVNPLPYLE